MPIRHLLEIAQMGVPCCLAAMVTAGFSRNEREQD